MLPKRMDVELFANGDHFSHYFDTEMTSIHASWDNDSQVLNLTLDESNAKDLYFWLLEVIPKLQRDRK